VLFFYTILFYCALPFIFLRLWWRGRRVPAYRENWGERLGLLKQEPLKGCIWLHTVSLGESIAALPLIEALLKKYPSNTILITNMTPTGRRYIATKLGKRVVQAYIPYDVPFAVKSFLQKASPKIAIFFETELWPNIFFACKKAAIPIVVLNARLSARSANGYQKIAWLTASMLQNVTALCVQSEAEGQRFLQLGLAKTKLKVTGNIKFDLEIPTLVTRQASTRPVWIAASTHEGEEALVLAAHRTLLQTFPNALLILVPRHPERFQPVGEMVQAAGFVLKKRTEANSWEADTEVYLGDTMGELIALYAMADVALVGGSLIPRGGHNLLEPAALQKPLLSGPSHFNFVEITELLLEAEALSIVNSEEQMAAQILKLFKNPADAKAAGVRAYQVVLANRGALQKQMDVLTDILK
jgi:3-deoxy-D-manno-octulosonic-acid transferase